MNMRISESSQKLSRHGDVWEAVLITPGRGSSGHYSEDMLRSYGPAAFPKGSHSYVGHLAEGEYTRDPKNLMAVLAEDAEYRDGIGLVGKLKVLPHWADFVEAVAPHTGLSISAMGEGSETEEGFVVESLTPDIQNTVDLVSYAGRGGALVERLYESAIKTSSPRVKESGPANADRVEENKEQNLMEISELAEKVDALVAAVESLTGVVTPLAESLKPEVKPEVDVATAVESAIDKAEEAGIPKELRASIMEAAKTGGDVDGAIAAQKAVVEAVTNKIKTSVEEQNGRFGGSGSASEPFRMNGVNL